MFRLVLTAFAALSIVAPALANMPPPEYDHPFSGKMTSCNDKSCQRITIRMNKKPVPYTDDLAAYRMCDRLHRAHYGTPYLDKGSMGIANMPRYGCTMYDADTRWMMVVYTYDTPAIAKKRLATTKSKQGYDQCMENNSLAHETGHANAYVAGDHRDGHSGWVSYKMWLARQPGACSYDKKAPRVPLS